MNNLEKHIDYLMSRNDCVIIPGLGALLARHVSASIDASSGTALPPHREFSFNSALVFNDGMIAHSIGRALEIPYDAALSKVNDAVAELDRCLHANGEVKLGNVGNLRLEGENLDFVPAPEPILSITTACLKPIKAIEKKKAEALPSNNETVDRYFADLNSHVRIAHAWKQAARIAASIVLLLGICFVASTPIVVDDAALASLSVELKQASLHDLMPTEEIAESIEPSINVYPSHGSYLSIQVEPRPTRISGNKRYYIIVGSFYSEDEAKKFLKLYPETNLGYINADNRYRIFDGAYDTLEEANKALKTTPFQATGAWISRQ